MEGYSSDLALFQLPMVEGGIEKFQFVEYRPTTTITEGASIDFTIPGSGASYIDWKKSRMYVKCRITRSDGTTLTEDDHVGPVNLTLHSLFRQVDVLVGGVNANAETGVNYAYKALLDVLLFKGQDVKESQL